jgi:transposase
MSLSVSGIGPIISSAMMAAIGAGDSFSKGRDLPHDLYALPRSMNAD